MATERKMVLRGAILIFLERGEPAGESGANILEVRDARALTQVICFASTRVIRHFMSWRDERICSGVARESESSLALGMRERSAATNVGKRFLAASANQSLS